MPVLSFRPGPAAPDATDPLPLPRAATLSEVFSGSPLDAAAAGFVAAALPPGPLLWLVDRATARDRGEPYLHGLGRTLLRATLSRPADILAAAEDGLSCPPIAGIVAELWGEPPALNFTASRRLAMRAERAGTPCWLIRHAASPAASAARQRWRVHSLPSVPLSDDPQATGRPRWQAELFRARDVRPGRWIVTAGPAGLDFAPAAEAPIPLADAAAAG